jgi:hypothetical protein
MALLLRWSLGPAPSLRGAAVVAHSLFSRAATSLSLSSKEGDDDGNADVSASTSLLTSLRSRLEQDFEAVIPDPMTTRIRRSAIRVETASVASRLANAVDCEFDQDTPRYLSSVLQIPSQQARVVVDSKPPYRVLWASSMWVSLTGITSEEIQGRPVLAALCGATSPQNEVSYLEEAMYNHQRGCGAVMCRLAGGECLPIRVTVSPLVDKIGSVSHMLCVVHPL